MLKVSYFVWGFKYFSSFSYHPFEHAFNALIHKDIFTEDIYNFCVDRLLTLCSGLVNLVRFWDYS